MEVGCDSVGVDNPVVGQLAGNTGDPSVVWLIGSGGERLEIVWPAGFAVRFDGEVELLDDHGQHVAFGGETVYLQVPRSAAAGSTSNPYFATGLLAAGPRLNVDRPAEAAWTGCYGRRT